MKSTKLIAALALAGGTIALPIAHANAGGVADSYTVTVEPASTSPGGSVHVSATDANTDGSLCDNSAYTVSIAYTKAGGDEGSTQIGSGTTDADNASIDTDVTIPSDAASTEASGVTASISVSVDCGVEQPPNRIRSHAVPNFQPTSTPAAFTVLPFTGSLSLSPSFAFRGTTEHVSASNCQGGVVSASFMSYGHEKTDITLDASSDPATGSFNVANDTTYGPGAVSVVCWQTSYSDKKLFVGNEEEEPVPTGHGNGGGSGGGIVHGVAKHAHPVKATPTFTG